MRQRRTELEEGLAPTTRPGPRPSAPGGGRGGGGGGCAEWGASAPRTSPGSSPRSRVCSRSIRASGRRAIIHAKGPCLDEGREGRASSQNHSPGRCLAFPSVSVMLRYLCGARNEGIQAEEVLSPRRTHRPRERTRLVFLFLWLLRKEAMMGPGYPCVPHHLGLALPACGKLVQGHSPCCRLSQHALCPSATGEDKDPDSITPFQALAPMRYTILFPEAGCTWLSVNISLLG